MRLDDALRATVANLPRIWREGWGAILLGFGVWSARPFVGHELWGWGWAAAAIAATLLLTGALARLAISADTAEAKRQGLGPKGLQLTRVEARLLGAGLLCGVFLAMILSVASLLLLAVFGGAGLDTEAIRLGEWGRVGPIWKLSLLTLLTGFCLFAVIALTARLSLFAPATVARAHMVSLNSMALTRGVFWTFLAGSIVTAGPKIGLLILSGAGLLQGGLGWIVWAGVLNAVQAPLTMAYLGVVYRRIELRPL
ncbi:hypothetical protein [Brevundimonas sp. SORGH_AS_0993]|uniref:hypothetical protein n=1 Tax=Brevundimonas sp. SORGH_AS_0993 TaxID=3041794 RepID=UPI00278010DC|nr:hypothetical protein [Brevundimonas sp. SORGH_AS_0993]MDQ1153367.1 hypothetical protein [Brevundimonas sp. SORGH_AS_0993]